MERSEFLSKLGLGLVVVCSGCALASCGGKSSNPTPQIGGAPSPPAAGSGNLFTLDLNSQLMNVGDSIVQHGVIIVRLAAGSDPSAFTAVQVSCTHQGTAINYNESQHRFICPGHGSEFSNTGQVLVGPATVALHEYMVAVSGTTLTVSA
jgi:Rieske Fe-S protein